jgi:cytochrome c oxidase subunit 2
MRRPSFLVLLCLLSLPAHAAVPERNFVVFFQEWSAALDPSAQRVISRAAAWSKAHADAALTVSGAADRTGSGKANQLLSELRAQVVTDQLAADGVPASGVRQLGLGAVGYALTSQMSRRVVISVAQP